MSARRSAFGAAILAALVLVVGGAWWLRSPTATGTWRLESAPHLFHFTAREDDAGRVSGLGVLSPEEGQGAPVTVRGLRVGRDVTLTLEVWRDTLTFAGRIVRRGVMTGELRLGAVARKETFRTGAAPAPAPPPAVQAARPDSAAAAAAAREERLQRLREILREERAEREQ